MSGEKMRRCDLFYKKAMERESWSEDDMCDPPTEPRGAVHILINELLEEFTETKRRVFERLNRFGGVKFYRYLNMEI